MRVDDRPVPSISGTRPDVEPWPVELRIGVERQPVDNYVYDDHTATYDSPFGTFVYDGPFNLDRFDLWCKFHGLTISTGAPDPEGRFDAAHVEMTLDNRDGSLSQYDAAGRLVDWAPGSKLDIWATIDGDPCWLFSGEVTAWRERQDDTVEVEAFDAFSRLNEDVPEWDPGDYGDTPAQRLTKICAEHNYTGPTRFDTGNVTLHSFFTNASPLEEMQNVAVSDGGVLAVDADGTLTYRDRTWIVGREDQPDIPTFSDNFCDAPLMVWDAEMTTDDEVIVNIANLTSVADVSVTARNEASVERYGPQTLPRTADQWIDEGDGQDLADFLVTRRADHYVRLDQFALHLHDPRQDLWRTGIDRRLGDIVTWLHEQPTTTGIHLVILNLAVQQITHDITPDTWTVTLATTRTVGNVIALRYDMTSYVYDEEGATYVH